MPSHLLSQLLWLVSPGPGAASVAVSGVASPGASCKGFLVSLLPVLESRAKPRLTVTYVHTYGAVSLSSWFCRGDGVQGFCSSKCRTELRLRIDQLKINCASPGLVWSLAHDAPSVSRVSPSGAGRAPGAGASRPLLQREPRPAARGVVNARCRGAAGGELCHRRPLSL